MSKEMIAGSMEEVKGEGKYLKLCKKCKTYFRSDSRGTRYCSQECCDKAQGHNRTKARRRREYDKNRAANMMLSTAYSLAHRVADLFSIPQDEFVAKAYITEQLKLKIDEAPDGEGPWELHHRNANPLDNNPSNLVWLHKNQHALLHSKKGKVNLIAILEGKESAPMKAKVDLFEECLAGFHK